MKEAQRIVGQFIDERPTMKAQDTPLWIAGKLKGEVDEMLAEITWGEKEPTNEEIHRVSAELADVVIYCLNMGNLLGVDVEQEVVEKIEHNKERFPAHLFQEGNFIEAYLKKKRELGELTNYIEGV